MKLTADEKEVLKNRLKNLIETESAWLANDNDSFSHGDWLRFEAEIKDLKSILKKLGRKK